MKKHLIMTSVAAALLAASQLAGAVSMSTTGGSGYFLWGDTSGAISGFDGSSDPYLTHFSATTEQVAITSVQDCCAAGDSFSLIVDGVLTPWDAAGFTGTGGLFEAHAADVILSAGILHTITFGLLTYAGGVESALLPGEGFYQYGSIQPSAVPLPAAALLFGSTLLGAAGFGRKQRAAKKQEMEALAA